MEIEQLIKWILGILVVVAAITATAIFFKDRVIEFFSDFVGSANSTSVIFCLIKGV